MADAATYYLDAVNGLDTNPGTSAQPWQTMAKAENSVANGDTVLLRSGNYGDVVINKTGLDRNSWNDGIVYRADSNATPVFTTLFFSGNQRRYLEFNGITVNTSTGDTCVQIKDSSYIKLVNMTIVGRQTTHRNEGHIVYGVWIGTTLSGANVINDIIIDGCDISQVMFGVRISDKVGTGIEVKNNNIHYISSSGISLSANPNDSYPLGTVLVDNNKIYDHLWIVDYLTVSGIFSGTFQVNETVAQIVSGGTATGTLYSKIDSDTVIIKPNSSFLFDFSGNANSITGLSSNATITTPVLDHVEPLHDSGIAIRCNRVTVTRNIIRNCGTTRGIRTYQDVFPVYGYNDIKIENNLLYDTYNGMVVEFVDIGDNFLFNNNTIIGYDRVSDEARKYWTALDLKVASTKNGSGFSMYNNILVGALSIDSPTMTEYHENNNIIWSVYDWTQGPSPVWRTSLKGDKTIIIAHDDIALDPTYFEGSGEFFKGGADFDLYNCKRQTRITDPYSGLSADRPHGHDLSDAYQLAPTSTAFSFANIVYAPTTDILGHTRVGLPDAGCYEYVSGSPPPLGNHAPAATAQSVTTSEDTAKSITLSGTDVENSSLTYSIVTQPAHGTLTGTAQNRTYTPAANYNGNDSFTFKVNDGIVDSAPATISITITAVNDTPVATAQSVTTSEDTAKSITLSGTDVENSSLTYSIVTQPAHGILTGTAPNITYTPAANYNGSDSFTFKVNDGTANSAPATVSITITAVNDAPVATAQSVTTSEDAAKSITLSGTDVENSSLTYSIATQPAHGTLTGTAQNRTYTPAANYNGNDSFTFKVNDGTVYSAPATITITVYGVDTSAPSVTGLSPEADTFPVPLNNLITLHIVDTGKGVNDNSSTIRISNNVVYTGNTTDYSSAYGRCWRTGTNADRTFTYQSEQAFEPDQKTTVTVNAADLAGNVMNEYSYSFYTAMRSFGKNKKVNSGSDTLNKGTPATVTDSNGNIWVAWDAGATGSRDVYIGKLAAAGENFGTSVKLTNSSKDKCNPAIAVDNNDTLYVAWQDNRNGKWDVYMSTCADGINWSAERKVTDSDSNHINPAIVADIASPSRAYIVWQDDLAGNQDIYIASSSDGFATKTVSRITSDNSDQTEPAIAADSSNTVYVVWTDSRNGTSDIYGAASNNGPWTNKPIVNKAGNQSNPAIATEADGTVLHFAWVDDTAGNRDIYYATSDGLPTSPVSGRNIVDDSTGADQLEPAIITTGSTGDNLKVFVCWQDKRNFTGSIRDIDLYLVEINSSSETNVCVDEDGLNANQSNPAIGIDDYGYPYLVLGDDRNTNTDIYYAGSTFANPDAIASKNVSISSGATVGTEPAAIKTADDVSVVIPPGAYLCDVNITISKVENPPKLSVECLSLPYEFGPSGIDLY